jgi:hypothetical protein
MANAQCLAIMPNATTAIRAFWPFAMEEPLCFLSATREGAPRTVLDACRTRYATNRSATVHYDHPDENV